MLLGIEKSRPSFGQVGAFGGSKKAAKKAFTAALGSFCRNRHAVPTEEALHRCLSTERM
jgi:hypothetical protein